MWACTRPGRSCMAVTGPITCLPQLLQNPWPGCTTEPHASQNIVSSARRSWRIVRCFDYFYRVLYNIAGAVSSTLAGDPQRLEAAILLRSPYGKSELVPFPFVHESGVRTSSAARSAWSTPTLQHIAQQTIRDSREKFRIGLVENGRDLPMQQISCSKSVTFQESVTPKIRRPPGNRAAFSFQGRIVPTEAKDPVKTFWSKSYEPKKQGVKQFLVNKCL